MSCHNKKNHKERKLENGKRRKNFKQDYEVCFL